MTLVNSMITYTLSLEIVARFILKCNTVTTTFPVSANYSQKLFSVVRTVPADSYLTIIGVGGSAGLAPLALCLPSPTLNSVMINTVTCVP